MKPTEMEEKFHEFTVPRLALAIKDHGYDPRFTFKEGREWHRIHHQTGGLACNHVKMWCTFLTVKEDLLPLLEEVNDKWLDSNIGVFGVHLEEVLIYRAFINKNLGADCDKSYSDFEEAIYPLDCSVQLIRSLCEDVLPDDLDELLHFENDFSRTLGFANRWKLYILGENCD